MRHFTAVSLTVLFAVPVVADDPPLVERYLAEARLADGEKALVAALEKAPDDDQLRFSLGTVQFLRSIENLGQALHRHGLRSDRGQQLSIPVARLPVPINNNPEELTYPQIREYLQRWVDDLARTEATLAEVGEGDFKLPLRVGRIQLDLTGDGRPETSLARVVDQYIGQGRLPANADLPVTFDSSDVPWLQGYCHLLMAMGETALAYDGQEVFDCTAHIFFPKVETPHAFLTQPERSPYWDVGDGVDIIDVISLIHVIRMPVHEPKRMQSALAHLEQMLTLSKENWDRILAEQDDDHEWIPNPRQTGAFGVPIRQEMIESWLEFIKETEAILAGERLVPFWRGQEERGVNLRKVFTEPRAFDLVLWVQGTAATPYLEEGRLTRPEVWDRLTRVFQGEFVGFALWFN